MEEGPRGQVGVKLPRNGGNITVFEGLRRCERDKLADGFCDANNNDMNCDFDGGDCCSDTCVGVDEDDSGSCSFLTAEPRIDSLIGPFDN